MDAIMDTAWPAASSFYCFNIPTGWKIPWTMRWSKPLFPWGNSLTECFLSVTEKKPRYHRTQNSTASRCSSAPSNLQTLGSRSGPGEIGNKRLSVYLKAIRYRNPKTTKLNIGAHKHPHTPLGVHEPWMPCVCWSPSLCSAQLSFKVCITGQPASKQPGTQCPPSRKTFSHCYF
jgi:hypothetical protein